eukprot:55471-Alexandrium_andersonii.AAC.1
MCIRDRPLTLAPLGPSLSPLLALDLRPSWPLPVAPLGPRRSPQWPLTLPLLALNIRPRGFELAPAPSHPGA